MEYFPHLLRHRFIKILDLSWRTRNTLVTVMPRSSILSYRTDVVISNVSVPGVISRPWGEDHVQQAQLFRTKERVQMTKSISDAQLESR